MRLSDDGRLAIYTLGEFIAKREAAQASHYDQLRAQGKTPAQAIEVLDRIAGAFTVEMMYHAVGRGTWISE